MKRFSPGRRYSLLDPKQSATWRPRSASASVVDVSQLSPGLGGWCATPCFVSPSTTRFNYDSPIQVLTSSPKALTRLGSGRLSGRLGKRSKVVLTVVLLSFAFTLFAIRNLSDYGVVKEAEVCTAGEACSVHLHTDAGRFLWAALGPQRQSSNQTEDPDEEILKRAKKSTNEPNLGEQEILGADTAGFEVLHSENLEKEEDSNLEQYSGFPPKEQLRPIMPLRITVEGQYLNYDEEFYRDTTTPHEDDARSPDDRQKFENVKNALYEPRQEQGRYQQQLAQEFQEYFGVLEDGKENQNPQESQLLGYESHREDNSEVPRQPLQPQPRQYREERTPAVSHENVQRLNNQWENLGDERSTSPRVAPRMQEQMHNPMMRQPYEVPGPRRREPLGDRPRVQAPRYPQHEERRRHPVDNFPPGVNPNKYLVGRREL